MSLVKRPRMTKRNLAAHRRNARLSRGPVTPDGLERSRAAQLRHGFYSRAEEVALRALGEDPADFLKILEALRGKYQATDDAQDRLVTCLARTLWRIDRADRTREGHSLRQAKEANHGRERRLHAQIMRLRMTADSLRWLTQTVAQPHYVATLDDLKHMKNLHQEGVMKEMGDVALALFFQLREPGTPGLGEPGECEDKIETARRVLRRIKDIFGLTQDPEPEPAAVEGPPDAGATESEIDRRYPNITAEEWEAREPVRQLLENILTEEVRTYGVQHKAILKELVAGPTPYERAAEITPPAPHATLLQRIEDWNLRQASHLLDLLEKFKRQEMQA